MPEGLSVRVPYDGEEAVPTNAGSYEVSAVVDDAKWEGSAEGMLVVMNCMIQIPFRDSSEDSILEISRMMRLPNRKP